MIQTKYFCDLCGIEVALLFISDVYSGKVTSVKLRRVPKETVKA